MKIRVFTAFSGYDSQCMALDRLKESHPDFNYELVGWSEIDKFAIQAHNTIFPQWSERNYGDISKIEWDKVPDFDFFTYSSPCQDFSNAGLQRGGEEGSGTRSSLLWECRKAIVAKHPKYLMMENVAALVSGKFLPLLKKWLEELEGYGYVNFLAPVFPMEWCGKSTKQYCLNAKNYGVPQNRERVIVFSILGGGDFVFPKPFPLERCLADVLEESVDDRYYLNEESIEGFFGNG